MNPEQLCERIRADLRLLGKTFLDEQRPMAASAVPQTE